MSHKYNKIEPSKSVVVGAEGEEVKTNEKKALEKIVSVQPKKVKRGLLSRLITGVLGPDGVSGIGEYVNDEIVKPAIKNIIVDAVTSGINMVMYGERGGSSRHPNYRGYSSHSQYQPRTNYTSRYTQNQPEPMQREATRSRYGVEEYLINERNDAAHVLIQLTENADIYGHVSVADYYDLIGVPSVYTDNQYGWTHESMVRAVVVPVRGGYVIRFPQVEVI